MEETKKFLKNNLLPIAYLFISMLFALPSIIYLAKNKTVYNFINMYSYTFITSNSKLINYVDTIMYLLTFLILFILYFAILKNINKIIKNKRQMFILIAIAGIIFCLIIPTTSLDIYSYIGNGWVDSNYHQNPYYTPVQEVLNNNGPDEMLVKVARCWKEETVVYGPAWSIICRILTCFSFGKITNAVFIFKIANFAIFIGCSWLIYKITKKKLFTIIFALNPFILFEFLSNVHNDIFLVFFILLSIYFIKNKKNLGLAIVSLAIATAIKYLSVILLPFIIIYALKDEELKNKVIKTILYVIEFCLIITAFYLIYLKDIKVLAGIFIQQNKYERSIMLALWYLLNQDEKIMSIIKAILLSIFTISYISIICKLFFSKNASKITFRKTMQTYQTFLFIFTFILITNFNAWYVIWLFPTIMWQKAKTIKTTLYISIGVIASYAVTYFTKVESRESGISYFIIIAGVSMGTVLIGNLLKKIKNKRPRLS